MYHLKRILLLVLVTALPHSFYSQTVPLAVSESRTAIEEIVKKIQKIRPRGVEIFLYPPYLVYVSEHDGKVFDELIPDVFVDSAKKSGFDIITMNILEKKDSEVAKSIIKNAGQDEIMWAARKMQYDAVLMVNIGKTIGNTRNVWSNKKKAFIKKEIYLLQANMFNPEDSTVYSRFSVFFFLDN